MIKKTKKQSKYYVTTKLSTKSKSLDYNDATKLKVAIKKRNPKAIVNITKV